VRELLPGLFNTLIEAHFIKALSGQKRYVTSDKKKLFKPAVHEKKENENKTPRLILLKTV